MSQRIKNLSLSITPKTRSQNRNQKRKNNRRTSLDVNLSYVSERISLSHNETRRSRENDDLCDVSKDSSSSSDISKGKLSEGGGDDNVDKSSYGIKPSSVILTRVTIPNKYGALDGGDERAESRSTRSQRGRSFSKDSTIILERSMDLTEVQGVIRNSMDFIPDTEPTEILRAPGLATVIPETQNEASFDMERTSMNVNTSLDRSFVLNPERSFLERGFSGRVFENEKGEELSQSSSVSSFGNIPVNSTIVTRAVVESNDSPCGMDSINLRRNRDNRGGIEERIEPSVIDKRNSGPGSIDSNENGSKNVSSSSSSSSLASSPSRSSNRKKLGDIYQRIIFSGISKSRDLEKKFNNNNNNKKKKLMRLRLSGMVDLSPVSVKQVRPAGNEPIFGGGRFKKRNNKRGKKKVAIKIGKRKLRFGASDEDDIDEAINPPSKDKRLKRIKAKKIVIKKFADVELRKRMNEDRRNIIDEISDVELNTSDDNELQENSSDDFEPKNNLTQRKTSFNNKIKIVIVATGLSVEDRKMIKSTVTSLGSARMQNIVSRRTTHVISRGIRTVNYLRGIIRGCWIVSFDWISKSREAGKWLDAESYEIKKLSAAIEKNRRERQLLKSAYVSELFLTCGSIHISDETSTPVSVLEELIRLGGGRVAPKPDKAKIIIGSKGLKEVWILDSITRGELQPFEGYSKKKNH